MLAGPVFWLLLTQLMRLSFHLRSLAALIFCWGSALAAHATHLLGAELTYEYAGTAANPNQYHVMVRLFHDLNSVIDETAIKLTCGKNECGTALAGSFATTLFRTGVVIPPSACTTLNLAYKISTLEGLVQLPPARWTLSIDGSNRAFGTQNVSNPEMMSTYVKAILDNTTGLINNSPRFTTAQLIRLAGTQPLQAHSLAAFDSEGDSLVYQLVQPLATPTAAATCGSLTVGAIAPHFAMNAATGELRTVASPAQQGRYALAARVDEYRRVNGSWQQIGSITRDMTYLVTAGANLPPAFTRVALTSNPNGQLLGQTIRVNPGQLLALTLTAADPDAGQTLTLTSDLPGIVPGVTFQDLGGGQAQLNWQVPATLPAGRYVLTANAADNSCPTPGAAAATLPILVTRQALATQQTRQPLAQPPFPVPFQDEVRFQFTGAGRQPVIITDELGRTVAQLLSAADGSIVWRPAATAPAGLYMARNERGTQVARLSYTGQ